MRWSEIISESTYEIIWVPKTGGIVGQMRCGRMEQSSRLSGGFAWKTRMIGKRKMIGSREEGDQLGIYKEPMRESKS